MFTITLAGTCLAFLALAVAPCIVLTVAAAGTRHRETTASSSGWSLAKVFCIAFTAGAAIAVASLVPAPLALKLIVFSAHFGVAAAVCTWMARRPWAGAFTALAGLMLASASVEFVVVLSRFLTDHGAQASGVIDAAAALPFGAALLVMWLVYGVPGLTLALVSGWLHSTVANIAGEDTSCDNMAGETRLKLASN